MKITFRSIANKLGASDDVINIIFKELYPNQIFDKNPKITGEQEERIIKNYYMFIKTLYADVTELKRIKEKKI